MPLLNCECGEQISVSEGSAGSKLSCRCGRILLVPSLTELRRRAGAPEPRLPPEMIVETLLLAGKLPAESNCVLCGLATDGVVTCTTECERARVESGRPSWWAYLLGLLTFGWLGVGAVHALAGEAREWGQDRIFPLPVRICPACRPRLSGPAEAKGVLLRVPLYRDLLEKFPHARVAPPSS